MTRAWQLPISRPWVSAAGCLLALALTTHAARGQDASQKVGPRPNAISLPTGPGSVDGMGESFRPELDTGGASYSIPIHVVPGTAGVTPSISLVYSSNGGNGAVGVGWSLSAASEIQRRTDRGVPKYDNNDTFTYNGRVLVPVGKGIYRLRTEGAFLRFQQLPDHWEVNEKDGTLLKFGESAAGRVTGPKGQVLGWELQEMIRPDGLRIVYKWQADGAKLYLSDVEYDATPSTANDDVHFVYEARADVRRNERAGFPIVTAKRLATVEVSGNGTVVWRYALKYDDSQGLSRLSSVQLSSADGSVSLPAIKMKYADARVANPSVVTMKNAPAVALDTPSVSLADVDGDGLPDVIDAQTGMHRWWRNLGTSFSAEHDMPFSPSVDLGSNGVTLADMNADGLVDLAVKTAGGSFFYIPNQGGSWSTSAVNFAGGPAFGLADPNVRTYDWDGDGRMDLVQATSSGWIWWRNADNGTWQGPYDSPAPQTGLDFTSPYLRLADFDGDGLVDVGLVRSGSVRYFPYMGRGVFGPAVVLANPPQTTDTAHPLQVADVNGDGLADVLQVRADSILVWLQTQGGFAKPVTVSNTPNYDPSLTVVRLADMNGDGAEDVLYSTPSAPPDQRWSYVTFEPDGRPNLLTSVDNGLGHTSTFTYASAAELGAKAAVAGKPWQTSSPVPAEVLTSVTDSDGLGWSRTTKYSYRDAYYDGKERQFRGFAHVEVTEPGDKTCEGSVRSIDFDVGSTDMSRQGKVLSESMSSTDGKLYQERSNDVQSRKLLTGTNGVAVSWAWTASTDLQLWEGKTTPATVRTEYKYDDYGNLLTESDWGRVINGDPAAGNDEAIHHTQWLVDTSRWLMLPTDQWVEDAAGKKWTETRTYYDGSPFKGLALGQATKGLVTRVQQWLGPNDDRWIEQTRVQRDPYGNVVASLDPTGLRHEVQYDAATHTFPVLERILLTSDTQTTPRRTFEFHAGYDTHLGLITSYTDQTGATTSYTYDGLARLTAVIQPGDSAALPTHSYTYTLGAPLSAVTTTSRVASGKEDTIVSRQYYDGLNRARGQVTQVDSTRWALTGWPAFDSCGHVRDAYQGVYLTSPALPKSAPQAPFERTIYDALGRPVASLHPDGTSATIEYAPLQTVTYDEDDNDPSSPHAHTPVTTTLDGLGRVVSESQSNAGKTLQVSFAYDPLGHLTTFTDAEGNVRQHTSNALGWELDVDDPDSGHTTFNYDAAGDLIKQVDATGAKVTRGYDELHRLLWADWNGDGRHDVDFTYDAHPSGPADANVIGRLAAARDALGSVTFSYDARGRLVHKVRVARGKSYAFSYKYDDLGRLTDDTYPDQLNVTRTYDGRGLVTAIGGFAKQEFDANGLLTRLVTGDGVEQTWAYDSRLRPTAMRLRSPSKGILLDDTYKYDAVGNPITIKDNRTDVTPGFSRSASYKYDDLYRLVEADLQGGKETWKYSPSGNVLAQHGTGLDAQVDLGTLGYGEGAGPHALTKDGKQTLRYDAAGRLIDDGSRQLKWNAVGQLASVKMANGVTQANEYGYDSSRAKREVRSASGSVEHSTLYIDDTVEVHDGTVVDYVTDGSMRIARATAAPKNAVASSPLAPWLRGLLWALLAAAGLLAAAVEWRASRGRARAAAPVALLRRALVVVGVGLLAASGCAGKRSPPAHKVTYLHFGRLGSVAVETRTGTAVREVAYRPYGSVRAEDGSGLDDNFTGKRLDSATGLEDFGARYYQPIAGRWISPDPAMWDAPTTNPWSNPYEYVNGRVEMDVDPNGREPSPADRVIAAAQKWQGKGAYPGVDNWKPELLKKGTKVFAGSPGLPDTGEGGFVLAEGAAESVGKIAEKVWNKAEVAPNVNHGYRTQLACFELKEDTWVAKSTVENNPDWGEGGFGQFYVEDFWKSLSPVEERDITLTYNGPSPEEDIRKLIKSLFDHGLELNKENWKPSDDSRNGRGRPTKVTLTNDALTDINNLDEITSKSLARRGITTGEQNEQQAEGVDK